MDGVTEYAVIILQRHQYIYVALSLVVENNVKMMCQNQNQWKGNSLKEIISLKWGKTQIYTQS